MNESQQTQSTVPYDDEIDLRELFRVLWAGKWLIGGITFAATVIAVIVALMLPNIYRAEALLAPNDQERAGGLSALAAQYGGLASLAGINIGTGQADRPAIALEVLKSRKFISQFIKRREILVPLMAISGWDAVTGDLEIDSSDYDVTSRKWVRNVRPPKQIIPSSQEAYTTFSRAMSVSQDKKTGFIRVTIQHYSPVVAKQWVDWLVEDINSTIMRQDVAEAEQAIDYLQKQIEATPLAELQNVFFNLIEEQMKTVMLARVSSEYVFRTLDPAVVTEKKVRPKRTFIALLGMFIGGVFGILLAFSLQGAGGRSDRFGSKP